MANIYDKAWSSTPDVTIYCDAAIDANPLPGSFGKGAFTLPSRKWFSTPWTHSELEEATRKVKHSSTHLELLNMLDAVLLFAERKQRVLCVCDNKAATQIATARYGASANWKNGSIYLILHAANVIFRCASDGSQEQRKR